MTGASRCSKPSACNAYSRRCDRADLKVRLYERLSDSFDPSPHSVPTKTLLRSRSAPATTNEVGEYAFGSVLPGTYTVRVSLPGFKTDERKGFRIGTQQSLVLDFLLEVGTLSEQITVTGEAPLVERASATQAASLDKEALQNLPIFGCNTFFAAISTPGVIQTGDPQFVRYQDQSGSSQLSLG